MKKPKRVKPDPNKEIEKYLPKELIEKIDRDRGTIERVAFIRGMLIWASVKV